MAGNIQPLQLKRVNMNFFKFPVESQVTPGYFAFMINKTVTGLEFCFAYFNDIIIFKSQK